MSDYKNTNSEGENAYSVGRFRYCEVTVCTELNQTFSLNRRGLAALSVTAWLRGGRSTQGERGAVQSGYRMWRLMWRVWA